VKGCNTFDIQDRHYYIYRSLHIFEGKVVMAVIRIKDLLIFSFFFELIFYVRLYCTITVFALSLSFFHYFLSVAYIIINC